MNWPTLCTFEMRCVLVLLLCHYFVDSGTADHDNFFRTLHGYEDPPSAKKTFVVERTPESELSSHNIQKRSIISPGNDSALIPKLNFLNDTHRQLMMHWIGGGSDVIICLGRDPITHVSVPLGPSTVYISFDYGDTYINKTELFKTANGTYASVEKFYTHPKYNGHIVFADVKHRYLYVTTNHGKDIQRIELFFTPSYVSFHKLQPSVFVVLDKEDPVPKLWVTQDFGTTWRQAQDFVKAFHWVKTKDFGQYLVVQRMEPSGYNSILYSRDFFTNTSVIQATDVKDFFVKEDYLFTTKTSVASGDLELYVSYKLGKTLKCVFDSQLEHRSYFIVDVTSHRALVAVSHTDTTSHLYVSENLDGEDGEVKFTLSLEEVLCYFPSSTLFHFSHTPEEAFADVYKVQGLSGIYIASRILSKPQGDTLGPKHFGSVITFDHGRSWRLIEAPERDIHGQQNSCQVQTNCSLHLSQKFSQLYPHTKPASILTSKSAPGVIIASGVLGTSLKGRYDVYISYDAGLTWKQTLRDLYIFNMGDHGGILSAVEYVKYEANQTKHLLYSTDDGETWSQVPFYDKDIRTYGLITEPGEKTTVFTMIGSLPEEHHWIIVKLDFQKAFKYNCTKDDYKTWFPSQNYGRRNYIPCVLGQQLTFHRRIPHVNCYNGDNIDASTSTQPCGCDIYDFECDVGFIQSQKPGNCFRNTSLVGDPYKVPLSCKPGEFYNRTKGYRKIPGDVCVAGFESHYVPEEIPCPVDEVEDFLLVAHRENISRFNLITRSLEDLPVTKQKNVIAVDFDMRSNCVYWADSTLKIIERQCLNTSEREILVSRDLATIEGMAFDWISNNLYFVDGVRSTIELIRTDVHHRGMMRRTVLGRNDLKKPRGIALHPKAGYMFWTEWSLEKPSVNRADLDGTNIKQLFGRPTVEWPNGITVDYIAERIYWVDARQDYIASSDLHGDYFKYIISHNDMVKHPYAVAVFKNNIYWDDWNSKGIFSANKDIFGGVEVLQSELPRLMELKVYAHGIQVGTNACTNSTCSYICVGTPKGASCLCPDGLDYINGKCLCPGYVPSLTNFTCPPVEISCGTNYFKCGDGRCIPINWRCDGENDCGDSSDEALCEKPTCPPNSFICDDGKCLPEHWKCDHDDDCSDGSDELNCPGVSCPEGQFTCHNGKCIPDRWKCDGENDCQNGTDEEGCEAVEPKKCKDNEFKCKSSAVECIPLTWQCDSEKDCRDGSDESGCKNHTCLETHFSCGGLPNKCIYFSWVCDGDKDCPNGKDEANCTTTLPEHGTITSQLTPKKSQL